MNIFRLIQSDFQRKREIFREDGANPGALRLVLTDGTSASILYRLMKLFSRHFLGYPVAFFLQWLNRLINGCVIGVKASFGPGFVIMHPVGVVINSKVSGGRNVTIESGVVIGDEKGRSPTLGNHIFIGSGAKIIGGLVIGDNVKIGANAVVTKSCGPDTTMLGIPAKAYSQRS